MKKFFHFFVISTINTILFSSCTKENTLTKLNIRLTDAPAAYEAVNIDLKEVHVNFRNDSTGWEILPTYAGVYDLLKLQNGIDTLIATTTIPSGVLQEIRLVLGKNNTVKVGDRLFALEVPSGESSGLKIKVSKNLYGALETIIIDFDAALSIHENGNGEYMLKPVIRLK
jgi:hypothetical protein